VCRPAGAAVRWVRSEVRQKEVSEPREVLSSR